MKPRKPRRSDNPVYQKMLEDQLEVRKLDEKRKQLSSLNETPKDGSIDAVGIAARMLKTSLSRQKAEKLGELATPKEQFIRAAHQTTRRAYKELPQFFKFRLFKNHPQRFPIKDRIGEYIRPIKEHINFRGLIGEVTYFEGELGDIDRMVYLAVLNEAIRHKEFVREFGRIPFSIDELAERAGLHLHGRCQELVEDALRRLMRTELLFKNGTGGAYLRDRFHMIEHFTSVEKAKEENKVGERIRQLERQLAHGMERYFEKLQKQAEDLLGKFKPRTPQLTLITFNKYLMDAINGDEITTVDMWALQKLTRLSARTLFLYLYDLSQWRTSQEPVEITLPELMELMSLEPNTQHTNGKEYVRWNRSVELVRDIFDEVNQVAKFIQYFEWRYEGESTLLCVKLSDETLQIPPK